MNKLQKRRRKHALVARKVLAAHIHRMIKPAVLMMPLSTFRSIWNNLRVHLMIAFKQSKDDGFSVSA